jgi:hypothetical protein
MKWAPSADINLGIGSGSPGHQTGAMLTEIDMVNFEQNAWLILTDSGDL